MKIVVLIATTFLFAGCMPEPSVRFERHMPEQLKSLDMEELEGRWEIVAQISSDCPSQWERSLPLGNTIWTTEEGALTIEGNMKALKVEKLWPIDENTFEKKLSMEFMDCAGSEELTFLIEHNEGGLARGLFSARLSHNGKALCQDLLPDPKTPESCETLTFWQARRR